MTVWVRLICALLVLFMLAVYMGSRQIRSHKVNIGGVLEISAVLVVKGPVLPLFIRGKTIGILGATIFWTALLGTAWGSSHVHMRRLFYVLFGVFIVMTPIFMVLEVLRGGITMAHAIG